QLNPSVQLPNQAIATVYRSDGSGTNFLFTDYLSKVSPKFKSEVGANTSVEWPVGIGAKGNEGVANMSAQTGGAIGYVEYAYAKQNNMSYVRMKNASGKIVLPEIKAFQAAAGNADWSHADSFFLILTNQPGDQSWPITGASFILMHTNNSDAGAAQTALKFFDWAYTKGDGLAEQLDYVPLPDNVVKLIQASWSKSIMAQGKALWPAK
ncbi:MAG TPA: phosphate ABC transporter substrate-binding protein PstS, partial [Steroidobacteraceae bacterium]|nr:phosphate ABC transporter substrate-binding protein PstS [Steroidobacteraceae bacterium]